MTKAVLFDFGGTLDSDGVHTVDQFRNAYEAAGCPIPPDVFRPAYFESDRRILAEFDMRGKSFRALLTLQVGLIHDILNLANGAIPAREEVVRVLEAGAGTFLERNRIILARLARRYRLGVVSNFCGNVDVICREYGLAEYLSAIVDSCIVGVGKPDPEIFRIALDRVGAEAGETVFVGDNLERDIRPAKALGMRTVWLREPGNRHPADAPGWDTIIRTLSELEGVL